jgi:hypothetical protein
MNEQMLHDLVEQVRDGRLARRDFIGRMVALGVGLPLASAMLAGVAVAQGNAAEPAYKPTKRGGGGPLRLLLWQGPTLLNPHFATGTKDQEGSRVFYESLARYDADGVLVPVLAAEIPSRANGGIAADGLSTTWKLKKNVQWHDGQPFSADDVVFNWQFVTDPAGGAFSVGFYANVRSVEKLDATTVRFNFIKPTPIWDRACNICLIPRHLFAAYIGAKSREAPANQKPVGTGPYKFVAFTPGDLVRGELEPELPPAQPAVLRHHRDEGRRRRHVGRACRAADRRVRLRLERAGGGQRAQDDGGQRQGPRRVQAFGQSRDDHAQRGRPVDRGRRRARQREEQALRVLRSGGPQGLRPAGRSQEHPGLRVRPRRDGDRQRAEQPGAVQQQGDRRRVQRRQGQRAARRRRLEARRRRRAQRRTASA